MTRYVEPTEKEAEEQMKLLRNGLHLSYGFAANFSRMQPIMKIHEDDLKEMAKHREAEIEAGRKMEDEAAEVADLLAPIEAIATAPRRETAGTPHTEQDKK